MSIFDKAKKLLFGDWILVKVFQGSWIDSNLSTAIPFSRCYYEVYYSPSKVKTKLRCGGFRPKEHNMYKAVVDFQYRLLYSMKEKNEQNVENTLRLLQETGK